MASTSFLRPLTAALVTLLAVSCAQTQRELPTAQEMEALAARSQEEYVIGSDDVLQITVWKEPELSVPEVAVRSDGKISVPLLDDVQAAGLTAVQLKAVITERLAEFITAPNVTVIVRDIRSKLVYVMGMVRKEGPVGLRADMRLMDAVAIAGGFQPFAGRGEIKLIRRGLDGRALEFPFDYNSYVDGENLDQNILLAPGDRIIVPEESPFWQ